MILTLAAIAAAVISPTAYASPPAQEVQVINTPLPVTLDPSCCAGASSHVTYRAGYVGDPTEGEHDLVSIEGSGNFVSAFLHRDGDRDDIEVRLIIDGETIIARTITTLKAWGFTQQNPTGVVVLGEPGSETVTIGFPQPIRFEQSLVLQAAVNTAFMGQLITNVIYGE